MKRASKGRKARIIFVTGTDTGVGKTLLTGLLTRHLRDGGCHALAMKPFCSGGRNDVEFLRAAQDGELNADEINPFYFLEPIAPLVSARHHRRKIPLREVLRAINRVTYRCECLVIEGSGGVLVPLGENYSVADLIAKLKCEVIVVSRNRLGTINHTLLTIKHLQTIAVKSFKVILMDDVKGDISSKTNKKMLTELLKKTPLKPIAYLGNKASRVTELKNNCKKIKKSLAEILA